MSSDVRRVFEELAEGRSVPELVEKYGRDAVLRALGRLRGVLRLSVPVKRRVARAAYSIVSAVGLAAFEAGEPLRSLRLMAEMVLVARAVGLDVPEHVVARARAVARAVAMLQAARLFTGGYGESLPREGIVGRRYAVLAKLLDALVEAGVPREEVEKLRVIAEDAGGTLWEAGGALVGFEAPESILSLAAQLLVDHVYTSFLEEAASILADAIERVEIVASVAKFVEAAEFITGAGGGGAGATNRVRGSQEG